MNPSQKIRKMARGKAALRKKCQMATRSAARQAARTLGASFNVKRQAA